MEIMPRPRPPHIQREVSRHGKVSWYFRRARGGERIRLPDEYGSAEFWSAYKAALEDGALVKSRAPAGTLAWLVEQYKSSAAWARLAPSTQRVRDNLLRSICETAGNAPIKHITKASLREGMDKRGAKPEAANAFLKAMRAVLAHAVDMEIIADNPAKHVALLDGSVEGVHSWTMDEVALYEAKHPVGTTARLAMDVMLYTGMRLSDLATIGRQHIRDGQIVFRPIKTRTTTNVTVTVRILPPLLASLEATTTGDMHLIVSQRGQPFVTEALGNRIKKWCREAGIPHCSAHGLRKASATRAAEAGATTHELMAMFGWSTTKEAERYTRAADRARMGLSGSDKLSLTIEQGKGQGAKKRVKSI